MDRTYRFRDLIEKLVDQMSHHRPSKAVIHSVEDGVVNLSLGGFPSLVKAARVIGDIDTAAPGSLVDILWDTDRPVVLLGGGGSQIIYEGGGGPVDNRTIENSHEGMRVKAGGIGLRHLSFTPALDNHTHDNPLDLGGWRVSKEGVLFNGLTAIHPNGDIILGEGFRSINLSSSNPTYRLWAGGAQGEWSPFSVAVDGKVTATAGRIGGWELATDRLFSDIGNDGNPRAEINASTPLIQLGGCSYDKGEGFWVGRHGSVYRLKIGNQQSFLRWTGERLEIQGDMQSANYVPGTAGWRIAYSGLAEFRSGIIGGWNIFADRLESDNGNVKIQSSTPSIQMGATGYLSGSGFWVGKDGPGYKMFVGNQQTYLAWDGDSLLLAADFRSANYIPGVSGWAAKPAGDAEFHNVTVRGALRSAILEYEHIVAVSGGMILSKASGRVIEGFTAGSSNFVVKIALPEGQTLAANWAVDDVVRVKNGLTNFWGKIISTSNMTGHWAITVSRLAPAFNQDFDAGVTLINYGAAGDGAIELDGKETRIRLYKHSGAPQTSVSDFLILGDLNNHFGINQKKMGLAFGDPSKIGDYLLATEDGIELTGTINLKNSLDWSKISGAGKPADGATVGAVWGTNLSGIPGALGTPSGSGLFLSATHMGYYTGGAWKTFIKNDGTFAFDGNANNQITWNGTTLQIKGNVVIMGGSGIGNLTDAGLLAAKNSVDLNSTDVINKSLANLDSAANTKLSGIQAGATVGASWNTNLSNIPSTLGTPSGSGLFLSPTRMGFLSSGTWRTYMDDSGRFYFAGSGNAYIAWLPSSNKLLGHNGTAEQWYASATDGKLYAGAGNVVFDSSGLSIKSILMGLTPPPSGEYPRYQLKFRTEGVNSPDFFTMEELHDYRLSMYGSVWGRFNLVINQCSVGTPEGNYEFYVQTLNSSRTSGVATERVGLISNMGCSFKTEAWKTATLNTGWAHYGGAFGNIQYFKDVSGVVHIQGLARETTTNSSVLIFTLPVGYRPSQQHIYQVHSWGGSRRVDIKTDGKVEIVSVVGNTNAFHSLAGICFRAI